MKIFNLELSWIQRELKKYFNDLYQLSYQLNYAIECDQLCGFAGKRVLEVGGCLPKELVIDHLGARQWLTIDPDPDNTGKNLQYLLIYFNPL